MHLPCDIPTLIIPNVMSPMVRGQTVQEWEDGVLSPDSLFTIDVSFGAHFAHFLSRDHTPPPELQSKPCLSPSCRGEVTAESLGQHYPIEALRNGSCGQ